MTDTPQPTRDEWRSRLIEKLMLEREHWDEMDRYYRGEQGIPVHADKSIKEAAKRLLSVSMTNTAQMIVEAPLDRMMPIGCRTAAAGDELGDEVGGEIWRGNDLTSKATLTFEEQFSMGMGYMFVGDIDPETGVPLITVEDPRECTVIADPATGRAMAGLKIYRDGAYDRLYLYLPGDPVGEVHKATRRADWRPEPSLVGPERLHPQVGGWTWDGAGEPTKTSRVPIVPFPNSPDAAGRPHAEFERHLGVIDRINYLTLQRLEIATMQAFRQRALKGGPQVDEDGNEVDYDEIFEAGPGAIWHIPETADLWESGAVDVRPLVEAEKHDFRTLAGVTGTPLFYIAPEAADGSAEGAALAKEKLVFKTKRHIAVATTAMKRVLSIAFEVLGDIDRSRITDIEIMWMPPERFSLAETADAAVKALSGGLSRRAVLEEIWRKTPAEVQRIEDEHAAEALMAQSAAAIGELIGGADPDRSAPAS